MDRLQEVALAIADGTPVDWDAVAAASTPEERGPLTCLRQLDAFARVHGESDCLGPSEFDDATPPATWGPLEVGEQIGRGSHGNVYRAWDPRLGRALALKIIRGDEGDSSGTALVREAHLLARVRHPNVVIVHGAERVGGRVGLWMELVEGTTLLEDVRRSGPLAEAELRRIGLELCGALGAVHAAGLLHRDVKAQNVMRQADGRVVLMDFGIGHELLDHSSTRVRTGTPLYLAPEVLAGAPASVQSDIYSLGVLLWFLATAAFPADGASIREIRSAQARGHRMPLRAIRPDLPFSFTAAIERCIETDTHRRPSSTAHLASALGGSPALPRSGKFRVFTGAILVAAISVLGAAAAWRALESPSAAPRQSAAFHAIHAVVMLPLDNRTGDPAFDGIVEEALARELSQSSLINVASRERIDDALLLMRKSRPSRLDLRTAREISIRDRGLRAILSTRLDRVGDRLIITAGLVDPATGQTAVTTSARALDAPGLPRALREIAIRLRGTLGERRAAGASSEEQLETVTTASLEALRAYTDSYRLGSGMAVGNAIAARALVEQALKLDPEFAAAKIWHAWVLRAAGAAPHEYQAVAQQALKLIDGTSGWEQHWIRGSHHFLTGARDAGAQEFERVVALRPDHERALAHLAYTYSRLRRPDDRARISVARARMRPNDIASNMAALQAFSDVGEFEKAQEYTNRLLLLIEGRENEAPTHAAAVLTLPAYDAIRRRDARSARQHLDQLAARWEQWPEPGRRALGQQLAHAYLGLGRVGDARTFAERLEGHERGVYLARIAAYAGDTRALRAALENVTVSGLLQARADGHTHAAIAFMIRAGLLDRAQREIRDYAAFMQSPRRMLVAPETAPERTLLGALALARGDLRRAVELLEADRLERRAAGHGFPGTLFLAKALDQQGDSRRAAAMLRDSLAQWEHGAQPQYHHSLPALFELSNLSRRHGDTSAAISIENDLLLVLAEADPDLAMLVELRSRRGHAASDQPTR